MIGFYPVVFWFKMLLCTFRCYIPFILSFQELMSLTLNDLNEFTSFDLLNFCTRCSGLAHLEDGSNFVFSLIAKVYSEIRRKKF